MADEYELLPVHPVTGLRAVGLLRSGRPVWPVLGASPDHDEGGGDDPDDDGGDDADGEGQDDAGKPPAGGWTPPSKADWDALQAKQTRANKESARRRKQIETLQAEIETLKGAQQKAGADADAAKTAAELAAAQQKVDAATKREQAAMRAAARRAIIAAGYNGARDGKVLPSLVGMVHLADLDIDDDGEVLGLDDQIEAIKAELPALFAPPEPEKPQRRPAPRVEQGEKKAPPEEQSWIDRLHRQVTGGAPRR